MFLEEMDGYEDRLGKLNRFVDHVVKFNTNATRLHQQIKDYPLLEAPEVKYVQSL